MINYNGLDILVNNAGITLDNLSIRLDRGELEKVIDVNPHRNLFNVCKYCNKKNVEKINTEE